MDRLRQRLKLAGAASIVVCELKPMQVTDVTPFNKELSNYLRMQPDGFGCRTQIRMNFLKSDGFIYSLCMTLSSIGRMHVQYWAYMSPVPPPLMNLSVHIRRKWETEWPRVGGQVGQMRVHGWRR